MLFRRDIVVLQVLQPDLVIGGVEVYAVPGLVGGEEAVLPGQSVAEVNVITFLLLGQLVEVLVEAADIGHGEGAAGGVLVGADREMPMT